MDRDSIDHAGRLATRPYGKLRAVRKADGGSGGVNLTSMSIVGDHVRSSYCISTYVDVTMCRGRLGSAQEHRVNRQPIGGDGMHRPRWGVALVSVSLVAAAAAVASGGAASAAARGQTAADPDAFASSFEPDDPQPTWTDTVDRNAGGNPRSSGVDGNLVVGMPGSLRSHVIAIAVNTQPNANENGNNLNDGDPATKWLADTPTSWAQYTLDAPATVVKYALTSANDAPERDP